MVTVTLDVMARSAAGSNKKRYEESLPQFAKRLTHLYLENKNIDHVGDDIGLCKNLSVLYLYDNQLTKVPELSANVNLTNIYLQNNKIRRMENFRSLPKLVKLYLGGNEITVVEGLEFSECLQELHLENQRLPLGEKLLFDPRTLLMLSNSLQILNVSGNCLDSIVEFECLTGLVTFLCTDSKVAELRELGHCLSAWRCLRQLDMTGNPVAGEKKFRDRVLVISDSLTELNGKEVTANARSFLRGLQESRERKKAESASTVKTDLSTDQSTLFSGDPNNSNFLPGLPSKHFQAVLQKAPSSVDAGSRKSADKRVVARLIAM